MKFKIAPHLLIEYGGQKLSMQSVIGNQLQFVECNTGAFKVFERSEFNDFVNSKQITILQGVDIDSAQAKAQAKGEAIVHNIFISSKNKVRAERRCAYIREAQKRGIRHAQMKLLEQVITVISAEIGDARPPSTITLCRWYKRYLDKDGNFVSMVDKFSLRGRRNQIDSRVNEFIEIAIDAVYLTEEKSTVVDVHHEVARMVDDYNHRVECLIPIKEPSKRTVERRLNLRRKYDIHLVKKGPNWTRNRYRSVKYSPFTEYPLQRVEVDHTPIDCFVLDDELDLVLGKPWLTAIRDSHTGMPLGIYISFQSPSTHSILGCIKSMITLKGSIRKRFPNIQHEWLAGGFAEVLVLDNAREFFSKNFLRVTRDFEMSLDWTAPYTPWLKGGIEGFVGAINRQCIHKLPGTTFSNFVEKGDYDSLKKAAIRFTDLVEIIFTWLLDVYMVSPNISKGGTPLQLWTEGIKKAPPFYPADPEEMLLMLGKQDERTANHEGISLHNLQYNNDQIKEIREQIGSGCRLKVLSDDTDISFIHVLDPRTNEFFKVLCIDQTYSHGMNIWHHEKIVRYVRNEMKSNVNLAALGQAKHQIRMLVQKALGRDQSAKGMLNQARQVGYSSQASLASEKVSMRDLLPSSALVDNPIEFEVFDSNDIPDYETGTF